MPEETLNQSQSINDLILDILADEAQIIRCLRVFFCETLQEIASERCISAERKVKLASELISAAAQKEAALAAVLEAISKFEVEPYEWIPIAPGASYPLPTEPPEITHVSFEVRTASGQISLVVLGSVAFLPDKSQPVDSTISSFDHSYLTPVLASEKMLFNTGDSTIYIRNLTTE